ncbi:MAG: hypothetical protein RI575_18890 [Balneolaceae bacterium]|nr:hypothetical protein [Balneolaceae bacterium]
MNRILQSRYIFFLVINFFTYSESPIPVEAELRGVGSKGDLWNRYKMKLQRSAHRQHSAQRYEHGIQKVAAPKWAESNLTLSPG